VWLEYTALFLRKTGGIVAEKALNAEVDPTALVNHEPNLNFFTFSYPSQKKACDRVLSAKVIKFSIFENPFDSNKIVH
jgi:hypothetical protein